jgi:hypothetical protein
LRGLVSSTDQKVFLFFFAFCWKIVLWFHFDCKIVLEFLKIFRLKIVIKLAYVVP